MPDDLPEHDDIVRLAGLFNAEETQLYYQIAVHGRNELSLAPDEYAGFTMTLLRMLAFRPDDATAAPVPKAAPAAKPAAATSAPATAPVARTPHTNPARAALEAARAKPKATPATQPPPWEDEAPAASVPAQKKTELAAAPAVPATTLMPAPAEPSTASELVWDGDWPTLATALPLRGVAQQLAQQTELVRWEQASGGAYFHLRSPVSTLCTPVNIERLATALTNHFGLSVRVTTEQGQVEQTANQKALDERAERQRKAEATIGNDPFVQELQREFGAAVVPGSIKST